MSKTVNLTALTLGSATLIVSGAAFAGLHISSLGGHTTTDANGSSTLQYGLNTAGAQNASSFDANGNLINSALVSGGGTCTQAGYTCTLMDGSGDGMFQYLVKNTGTGQTNIELMVGSRNTDDGLFLLDQFVTYNGNGAHSANSVANKMIIQDAAYMTSGGTAAGSFTMDQEWLRGAYQTESVGFTGATNNCNGGGGGDSGAQPCPAGNPAAPAGATTGYAGGIRMDAIVNQTIVGVQSFHAEGMNGENGDFSLAGAIQIDQGTNGTNTSTDADTAQAMGVFSYRFTGGQMHNTDSTVTMPGGLDYSPNPTSITLGGQTVTVGSQDGVSAVYIGAQGYGYNGGPDYGSDDATLRHFAYVGYQVIAGGGYQMAANASAGPFSSNIASTAGQNGFPNLGIGTFTDPQMGVVGAKATLSMTSQVSAVAVVTGDPLGTNTIMSSTYAGYGLPIAGANNTIHPAGFNNSGGPDDTNDTWGLSSNHGDFTNASALLTSWTTVFGDTAATPSGTIGSW